MPLPPNASIVIGRKKQKGGLQLSQDEEVSATHCLVRHLADGSITVEDLSSLNGTRVAETVGRKMSWVELAEGQTFAARAGNCIEIGGSALVIERESSVSFAPATGTRKQAVTTGKKTVARRAARSKSPAAVASPSSATPSPGGVASPIPLNFDSPSPTPSSAAMAAMAAPPSPAKSSRPLAGSLAFLVPCVLIGLAVLQHFVRLFSAADKNWAPFAHVVAVHMPNDTAAAGMWSTASRRKDISMASTRLALGNATVASQCWWAPTPWASLVLELPACVALSAVRLSTLVDASSELATSSPLMVPRSVVVTCDMGASIAMDVEPPIVNGVFVAKLALGHQDACVRIVEINVTSQVESPHGACVHRIELLGSNEAR